MFSGDSSRSDAYSFMEWFAVNQKDSIMNGIRGNTIENVNPWLHSFLRPTDAEGALANYIAELYKNSSVKKLNFSWLNIDDSLGGKIAGVLQHNSIIEEIDLSHTGMSNKGVQALACALEHNHSLVKLGLGSGILRSQFSDDDALSRIHLYLERNKKEKQEKIKLLIAMKSGKNSPIKPESELTKPLEIESKEKSTQSLEKEKKADSKYDALTNHSRVVFFQDKNAIANQLRSVILSEYIELTITLKPKHKLFQIILEEDSDPLTEIKNAALMNTFKVFYKNFKLENNKITLPFDSIQEDQVKNFKEQYRTEIAKVTFKTLKLKVD